MRGIGKIRRMGTLFVDVDLRIAEYAREQYYKIKKLGFELNRPIRFEHITIIPHHILKDIPHKAYIGLEVEFEVLNQFKCDGGSVWALVKYPLAERIREVYNLRNQHPLHITIGNFKHKQEEIIAF